MNLNIFALELCLRLEPAGTLRGALHELIRDHPSASSPGQKWALLRSVTSLLLEHRHLFEKGCWDFFEDDGRARRDYEMWSNGLITEEGARAESSGIPGESGDGIRYMTFTISLLLAGDSACARELSRVCDIPEAKLWERETFVRILHGLSRVSFSAVRSDVFYLIPGAETWGLTAEDLTQEKFDYLRPIA
jgi:hypothetical protein